MFNIPMRSGSAFNSSTISNLNGLRVMPPLSSSNLGSLNGMYGMNSMTGMGSMGMPGMGTNGNLMQTAAIAAVASQAFNEQNQQQFNNQNNFNAGQQNNFGAQPQNNFGAQPQNNFGAGPQNNFGAQPQNNFGTGPQNNMNNQAPTMTGQPQAAPAPIPAPVAKPIPALTTPTQKGQKVTLDGVTSASKLKACFGWNTSNGACDVDVSAFMLGANGKVIGDDWFVFYGQPESPDKSTVFTNDDGEDREIVTIDFSKLNPGVTKIVFVLTINEALQKNLNFSMLSDAYVRIMDASTNKELRSFKMDEYYSNVTSMMIGEVYQHNGAWKFNAVGNGVAKDLEGLCELYGVQVV